MRRHILALALVFVPAYAWADDAAPADNPCSVTINVLSAPDQGGVSIGCSGVGEAFGGQLSDVLNTILARRLDPQQVLAALGELAPVPAANAARELDGAHRQLLVQALVGKEPEQIAIGADPKSA